MRSSTLTTAQVERYGITEEQLSAIKARLLEWAEHLDTSRPGPVDSPSQERLEYKAQAKHLRMHGFGNEKGPGLSR